MTSPFYLVIDWSIDSVHTKNDWSLRFVFDFGIFYLVPDWSLALALYYLAADWPADFDIA